MDTELITALRATRPRDKEAVMHSRCLALVGFALFLITPHSSAAEDAKTLAARAQAILKTNCHRCHGQDGSVEGGMNYVIDLKALVARRKVIPGSPARSRLFKRVTSADNPMPPEEEKVRPSKEEIAVLEQWIQAGAPEVSALARARAFLTEADVLRLIAADLRSFEPQRRPFLRYFTIHQLHNAGLADGELQTYRHGLAKL